MTDGMNYEQTKVRAGKFRIQQAEDILSKRDNAVLDKMPSRTIVMYIYHRHSTGTWITVASLSWLIMFVIYLGSN